MDRSTKYLCSLIYFHTFLDLHFSVIVIRTDLRALFGLSNRKWSSSVKFQSAGGAVSQSDLLHLRAANLQSSSFIQPVQILCSFKKRNLNRAQKRKDEQRRREEVPQPESSPDPAAAGPAEVQVW